MGYANPTSHPKSDTGSAEAWRGEVLQYIAEGFPKVALTSAFLERLQSEWTLEHLQQIAEAVKVEYGASRAGYALEVYLALQRVQSSAENGSFSEAEDVNALLDGLKVVSGKVNGEMVEIEKEKKGKRARLAHVCSGSRSQAMASSALNLFEGLVLQGLCNTKQTTTVTIVSRCSSRCSVPTRCVLTQF